MSFWDDFFSQLEQAVAQNLPIQSIGSLLAQGRLWSEWQDHEWDGDLVLFELQPWVQEFQQRYGSGLRVADDLQGRRKGHPDSLEILLRALLLEGSPLELGGDERNLWVHCLCCEASGLILRHLLAGLEGHCDPPSKIVLPWPVEPQVDSCVDLEILARSALDDREFEGELIQTFLAEAERQLESLRLNFSARTLHSLKGSASMMGALPLAGLIDQQERLMQPESLPQLQAEFERVARLLKTRIEGHETAPDRSRLVR